jgi:outer membrane protein TolC
MRFLIFLVITTASFSADTLTLESLLSEVLKNNFGVKIAKNQEASSKNNRVLANSNLLPTLDLEGNLNYTETDSDTDPAANSDGVQGAYNQSLGLRLNWTLFDGFRMFRARALVHRQSDLDLELARQQIETAVLNASRAFLALLSHQQKELILREQLEISRHRLMDQQHKKEMGATSSRELLGAQVVLNTDSSAWLSQLTELNAAQNRVNILIGRTPSAAVFAAPPPELPPSIQPVPYWSELSLKNNTSLKSLRLGHEIANLNVAIKSSAFWPMLIFVGSYGWSSSDAEYLSGQNNPLTGLPLDNTSRSSLSGMVGLNLRWNLFNGLLDKTSLSNAKLRAQDASWLRDEAQLKIESQVYELWLRAENALKQYQFDQSALELARQNFAVNQEAFQTGQVNSLSFREAQQALLNSELRLETSRLNAALSLMELEQSAGILRIN